MTKEQRIDIHAKDYINIGGNYEHSIVFNQMYHKRFLEEYDWEQLFSPKPEYMTGIGKITLIRLYRMRDELGIIPSFEGLVEVFNRVKSEQIPEVEHKRHPEPTKSDN